LPKKRKSSIHGCLPDNPWKKELAMDSLSRPVHCVESLFGDWAEEADTNERVAELERQIKSLKFELRSK
jgi:hypothetical protein